MVFKGTASRTAFELARDMEALGGQLDAYTTKEHTAYTLKVLPDQLEDYAARKGWSTAEAERWLAPNLVS